MSPPRRTLACVALPLLALLAAPSGWCLPLETYGRLPQIEEVALSPDGSRIAFVRTQGETRFVAVVALATRNVVGGLRVGDVKLRNIEWADNDHLLLTTSATGLPWGVLGREQEWYLLDVYSVSRNRTQRLPEEPPGLRRRVQMFVTGHVMVRHLNGHTVLFVPGFYLPNRRPVLLRHDLDSGAERTVREGTSATQTWIVDAGGEIRAEEDYDEPAQRWSVLVSRNGRLRETAGGRESIDYPRLLGFGPTSATLLMEFVENDAQVWRLLSMADGTLGPPMPERDLFEAPIEDHLSYQMIGGVHVDDETHYIFFDSGMQALWQSILNTFPGERVSFVSASADFARAVVRVDGAKDGYRYELVDLRTHTAEPIGDIYDGLKQPLEVRRISYAARDGFEIPAYLTLPRGREPKNLPLIVLPHGGPAVRDTADFDWWSQALADQGYAVLRPNYRGSSLNRHFISAGFGEWGRKMQTDLSDGVRYLASEGIADPKRVCIVGGSYGGYAALAGVTLDAGVYRCAVAVAGISDVRRFLRWEQEPSQHDSKLYTRFWDRFMGVSGPDDPLLGRISPISHLDAVSVPILLIHGRDDTVVPFEQSERMFDALRRAHKDVQLVTLKHEDHWLSRSETRLQMLTSSVSFLRAHNPPD